MSKHVEVAIIGGGMTGLAAAIALARLDIQTVLIDKADLLTQQLPEFDGRVSAISLGSQRILQNLGIWEGMQPYAEPILDICVHESGGFGQMHYDHRNVGDEPMGHIVENRHSRTALLERAKQMESLEILAPIAVEEVSHDHELVSIALENGRQYQVNLLIAADGKSSRLRKQMQFPVLEADYKQTAMVATIGHSESHHGVALERFFSDGPFAVLPMPGNRSSLVWVESTETARALMALSEEQWLLYLQEKMQGYLGELTLESRRWSYPLTAVVATKMVTKRAILLGDAAHGIHPIAGQGVNVGYRDVAVLEEVLADAKAKGQDLGSSTVLEVYQQWRRFDTASMFGMTDGLNRLFSNDSKTLYLMRNTGFSVVNQWPQMRDFLMRHAMGVEGDLPRLAK